MARRQLTHDEIEPRLDLWLETEFTFHAVAPVAHSLAQLARDEQDFVLSWIKRIASTHVTLAFHFAKRAPDLIRRLDPRAIEAWAIRLCDTYDRAGIYAALSAAEQADAYAHASPTHAEGALFDDVAGVLGNFVHGLSGRKLAIEQGDALYTDGEKIVLPAIASRFPEREDNFKLLKAMVALLWAQTRFGTLRADLTAACAAYPHPERALHQFNALETLRLTARLGRELPGLHRDIVRLKTQAGDALPAAWQTLADRVTAADARVEDSLALLDAAYRLPDFAAWCYQGELRPDAIAIARAARVEKEKARLRIRLAQMLEEHAATGVADDHARRLATPDVEATPRDEDGVLDFEITLDGAPLPPPEDVKQLLTSVWLDFGEIPPEHLTPAGDGEYDPRLVFDQPDDPDTVWQGTYHEEGAELYPEWDHGRQHYRKNWCVMREKSVPPVYDDFYRETLARHAGLIKHLRRKFEALRDENRFEKRQTQGDEIDLDALVEALADARDGREMSDRLFVRMHRAERNIAVAFLVDMSGSTKGWINEAEREALILLCEALELLGDRYAIYGFSGTTRKRCELFRIKTFDEAYSDEVKARISGIRPQEYTRMGFALRHMTKLLNRVDAKTRVLVTLSDGRPDDYFDVYRGQYGVEDTRMALLEAARTGIHPFCITLDREARDYLPYMYGAARYIIIDDVRQLPVKVTDIYRRITT